MVSFRLLPALITLSLAFPLGTMAQPAPEPAPENEAALLQEMLRAKYALSGEENVQIFVGQLPDSLLIDLPLPEEAQIVGSIVSGSGYTDILLRVNQSPEEIYSLYQQQLPDRGWQVEEIREVRDGFLPGEAIEIPQTRSSRFSSNFFCLPSQSIYLTILAQPQTDSSTVVNLSLSAPSPGTQPSECFFEAVAVPLPPLTLPTNAQFLSGGSSSGNDEASSNALIQTDLEAEALINHYATQLQQAGWTQVETSEVGLSRWSYQDEEGRDWQGLLVITEIQGVPNQYSTYVQILRRPEAI